MELDMKKYAEKFKQEVRIYFVLGNILMLFFSWISVSYEIFGLSSGTYKFSGFTLIRESVPLILLIIVPIGLLVMEFVFDLGSNKKIFYLIASIVMILDILIFATSSVSSDYSDAEYYGLSVNMGIGYFGSLILYVLIAGWTLVKDFKVSKKGIKEKGFKQSMQDVMGQVSDSANEIKDRNNK